MKFQTHLADKVLVRENSSSWLTAGLALALYWGVLWRGDAMTSSATVEL